MLSHRLGFRRMAGSRLPTIPLSFKSRGEVKDASPLFPNFSAPLCPNVSEQGNGAMSRSLHFEANKGTLLYFRLRSESVIVIFANYSSIRRYYRAYASRLCMLAYRFYTLSKPVTPLFKRVIIRANLCVAACRDYSSTALNFCIHTALLRKQHECIKLAVAIM